MMDAAEFPTNDLALRWMDPYELMENPLNPREHPQLQRRSLHTALQSLGWLQPLLFNSRTGRLIDGHLRRQEAIESGITSVPVLVVDLDESQERAALASIDQITAQAQLDDAQFGTSCNPWWASRTTWLTHWWGMMMACWMTWANLARRKPRPSLPPST